MFGSGRKRRAEEEMAEWLAHPNEFGVRPTSVCHERTYNGTLPSHGDVSIRLVEYVMPDGTSGRGFVNWSLTWSFIGEEINRIPDDDLLLAYCGWAWLFPALQSGSVQTKFASEGEEARFLEQKRDQGVSDVEITNRYRIGTSELFEFTGTFEGKPAKGARNTGVQAAYH